VETSVRPPSPRNTYSYIPSSIYCTLSTEVKPKPFPATTQNLTQRHNRKKVPPAHAQQVLRRQAMLLVAVGEDHSNSNLLIIIPYVPTFYGKYGRLSKDLTKIMFSTLGKLKKMLVIYLVWEHSRYLVLLHFYLIWPSPPC
jgi:hypothetical protein